MDMLEPHPQSTPLGTPEAPTPDPTGRALVRGVFITLLGGALWGANGTVSKFLMDVYSVDPLWLACVRELSACWLFLGMAFLRNRKRLFSALKSPRDLWSLFLIAMGGIVFSQVAYLEAIDWTDSGTATVLQSLEMPMVLVFVCLTTRRWPRKRESFGLALALIGTYLVATAGSPTQMNLQVEGLVWGLICAVAAAVLAILPARMMRRWGNFVVNGVSFLMAGLLLSAFVRPWENMPVLDWLGWTGVIFSVVIGTFGAYGLYLQGVKEVGSVRGSLLATSEPVVATITSILFLGESFSGAELLGFVLIIITVFLTV